MGFRHLLLFTFILTLVKLSTTSVRQEDSATVSSTQPTASPIIRRRVPVRCRLGPDGKWKCGRRNVTPERERGPSYGLTYKIRPSTQMENKTSQCSDLCDNKCGFNCSRLTLMDARLENLQQEMTKSLEKPKKCFCSPGMDVYGRQLADDPGQGRDAVTTSRPRYLLDVGRRGPEGDEGPRGYPGPAGDPGPGGTIGPPGPQGQLGPIGPQGRPGAAGPFGPRGPKGDIGDPGVRGVQGPLGPRGEPGFPGPAGIAGPPGRQGEPGMPGEVGQQGDIGPKGDRGDTGIPGQAGSRGRRGYRGPRGIMGRQGLSGAHGGIGDEGPPGRSGLPGTPGRPGLPGEPGPQGSPGIQGRPGSIRYAIKGSMDETVPGIHGIRDDILTDINDLMDRLADMPEFQRLQQSIDGINREFIKAVNDMRVKQLSLDSRVTSLEDKFVRKEQRENGDHMVGPDVEDYGIPDGDSEPQP